MKRQYLERLSKAFPKELNSDAKAVMKILPFENNEVKLCDGKIHHVDSLIHENQFNLQVTINFDNSIQALF